MLAPTPGGGSLTVVGTGIDGGAHLTAEARAVIEAADEVLYVVAEPLTERLLERLNPRARSLGALHYGDTKPRWETYDEITEALLASVRTGARVCAVFYGHPGILVDASHEAVAQARAEGFATRMLPAISALDCLFADLGLDPARSGLVSFEATALLLYRCQPDVAATLVLWQPEIVGELLGAPDGRGSRLSLLVEYLCRFYPAEHETIVYKASPYSVAGPIVRRVQLGRLTDDQLPRASSLVLPPLVEPQVDPAMLERLRLTTGTVGTEADA